MGMAMAPDFIEFMEYDLDLYSMLVEKVEDFMAKNKMKFDEDLEADLCQAILENVRLTNQ